MNIRRTPARRAFVASTIITVVVFVISLAVLGYFFVGASEEARAATSDAAFPRDLFGLPILEGFSNAGRFGVHLFPGVLVFLVVPVLVGLGTSIPGVRRFVRARD